MKKTEEKYLMNRELSWLKFNDRVLDEAGNAREFKTGDWRSMKPVWDEEKCKQCGLCFAVCPDNSIPVGKDCKRTETDFDYCKGCGVCAQVCPKEAIIKEVK